MRFATDLISGTSWGPSVERRWPKGAADVPSSITVAITVRSRIAEVPNQNDSDVPSPIRHRGPSQIPVRAVMSEKQRDHWHSAKAKSRRPIVATSRFQIRTEQVVIHKRGWTPSYCSQMHCHTQMGSKNGEVLHMRLRILERFPAAATPTRSTPSATYHMREHA